MRRELREEGAVIKCLHCHDARFTTWEILDAKGRVDTNNPLFGQAFPCLWCAEVRGGLYRYTDKGQEQMALMRELGYEVPRG